MLDERSHSFLGEGAQPWVSCSSAQELRAAVPGRPAAPLPGARAALPARWVTLEDGGLRLPSALCLGTAPNSRGAGRQLTQGCWFHFFPAASASSPSRKLPLKRSPPPLTPGGSPCGHRRPLTAVRSPLFPGPSGCAHQSIGAPENPANHRGRRGADEGRERRTKTAPNKEKGS